MTALVILATVLATAVLSGVIGMAGGVLLMAVLVTLLPVASAMILHGAVQAASNGARFLFLREHVMWGILPLYAVGAVIALLLFVWVAFVPDPALVLILVGCFPWLARLLPTLRGLDVRRPLTGAACGVAVTAAQLLAGASGTVARRVLSAYRSRPAKHRRDQGAYAERGATSSRSATTHGCPPPSSTSFRPPACPPGLSAPQSSSPCWGPGSARSCLRSSTTGSSGA